ncbi:MAG TPA: DUF4390 domain-containing protein [Candidatus Tectomicrobia bacterium]|nr:DUF4390 domain-containing protein [Candidatus Tectomicrobia bacterium]
MRRARRVLTAMLAALAVTAATPASADLRISDLAVFLNDHDVTVQVVLLDALPASFREGLESGIPAHVRYTVELWQYTRFWVDRLLLTRVVERQIAYDVVTREYRVKPVKGEIAPAHVTRDLRDAQRAFSEIRALKLAPAGALAPGGVIYVRVHAETALNGDASLVARMAGTAAQASRQSEYRSLVRTP